MKKLFKIIALILAVCLLPVFAAEEPPAEPTSLTTQDYADKIVGYYENNPQISSWWDVVALYSVGEDLTNYTLPEWTTETLNENSSVTDYAGIIFGLIASGENVHNIWGRDIAEELAEKQDKTTGLFGTYPTQQIYSILALNAAKEPYDKEAAMEGLMTFKTENGAFGYSADSADPDVTAMAMLVLNQTNHSQLIASCTAYLAGIQLESGGFASWGTENANTLETILWAFSTHNLLEDERFIKNEKNLETVLTEYILDSGMLAWEQGTTDENLMATQQGLIAFGDIINGKSVFLRLSSSEVCSTITASVRIEGSSANVLNTKVTVKGYNPNLADAIKCALDKESISYTIEDGEYGAYIKTVNDETAGKFGGWDGWLVVLNGQSISSSADRISLTEDDQILLYYGMFAPDTLIPQYSLSASEFTENVPFDITVTSTYFDYTTSQDVTVPIKDATVMVGDAEYTTNEQGKATIIPVSGTHQIKIYKESENSYPSIVRIVPFEIDVDTKAVPIPILPSPSRPSTPSSKGDKTEEDNKVEEENKEDKEEAKEFEVIPNTLLTYSDADEISDWALADVKAAVSIGFFVGDENNNFNPSKSLSRGELALLTLKLTGDELLAPDGEITFTDMFPEDWCFNAVYTASFLGYMSGTGENTFDHISPVSREQVAVVLAKILKLEAEEFEEFSDSDEISDWAKASVYALSQAGIMVGDDNHFKPKALLTREMCASILVRTLNYLNK